MESYCSLCTFKVPQGESNLILCTLDTIHRLFFVTRLIINKIIKVQWVDSIFTWIVTRLCLCPIHATFLVCYCIFLVDVILFAILSEHVKNTLKRVMRKCLRDMREMLKRRAIGWSVQILLIPFKH